jgi:RsiW-degrading membrane proteinase PrsW (M82 family)
MDTVGLLFTLALAPTLAGFFYMYIRDKYEKEPLRLLVTGITFGALITFPVIQTATYATILLPVTTAFGDAAFASFVSSSLVEEGFKFAVLFLLIWFNRNLNEPLDGIVYAVFISLGFAGLENFLYVFNPELGGISTAVLRAVFSVPGHALFGVTMGYFFALAKFEPSRRGVYILCAFVTAWLMHGVYNFILMAAAGYFLIFLIPFAYLMWRGGLRKIKRHLEASPFKTVA